MGRTLLLAIANAIGDDGVRDIIRAMVNNVSRGAYGRRDRNWELWCTIGNGNRSPGVGRRRGGEEISLPSANPGRTFAVRSALTRYGTEVVCANLCLFLLRHQTGRVIAFRRGRSVMILAVVCGGNSCVAVLEDCERTRCGVGCCGQLNGWHPVLFTGGWCI